MSKDLEILIFEYVIPCIVTTALILAIGLLAVSAFDAECVRDDKIVNHYQGE